MENRAQGSITTVREGNGTNELWAVVYHIVSRVAAKLAPGTHPWYYMHTRKKRIGKGRGNRKRKEKKKYYACHPTMCSTSFNVDHSKLSY